MSHRYTAAHWGTFRLVGQDATLALAPLPQDAQPSRIARGWVSAMQNAQARIARPAIRAGWLDGRDRNRSGDAAFREVPWDEALDILAAELTRVTGTQGNKSLFAGSYGWASAGRFHHAQSQLRRFLNTIGGHVGSRNTYSHAAAEVLFPYILGQSKYDFQDRMTSWPNLTEHCDLMVAFGGISTRTAQIDSAGTMTHEVGSWMDRATARGMACVNISPLATDLPGAEWIAPRPGTDTALILGLAHEIFRTGLADREFLRRCTIGAETFEVYVTGAADGTPKTADWAAEICDIPADTIRALAARMAASRTMISMAWSMQRADHGEQTVWAGLALAAILGQIGQPGGGFGFGYGSTTPVGRAIEPIDWPSVPQGHNPVADYIPVARVADMLENPSGSYTYDGEVRRYPDARLVWWSGGNPFHHHQDLNRLDAAWRRPETIVVMDHSWTATARRADIVLPTTGPLERTDIMMNRREAALVYMSAGMAPFGQARDDYDILAGLARRMGTEAAFTEGRSSAEWIADLYQRARPAAADAGRALPGFEKFQQEGVLGFSGAAATHIQLEPFVRDPDAHPLGTVSGRIELECRAIADASLTDCPAHPTWIAPAEWLGAAPDGSLHLLSNQPDTRLHAQFDQGSEAQASKIEGREACTLHPDAAAARGLKDGDIACLENARGACLAGVITDARMRADCIVLPTGAWLDLQRIDGQQICVSGNPNVLTLDKGSSGLSQGNIAHTALVQVRKWDAPVPPLRVNRPPTFE